MSRWCVTTNHRLLVRMADQAWRWICLTLLLSLWKTAGRGIGSPVDSLQPLTSPKIRLKWGSEGPNRARYVQLKRASRASASKREDDDPQEDKHGGGRAVGGLKRAGMVLSLEEGELEGTLLSIAVPAFFALASDPVCE
eukprot:1319720-Amorphochlora_amoeboformis.AAC.2